MAAYQKIVLSGSVDGLGIILPAVASPGTLIHTAGAGIVNTDEIWLYVTNNHTANLALTIQFGGLATNYLTQLTVPFKQGQYLVIPGFILRNGLVVRAYAQTANLLSITGWVNRILG